jgi:O-antigen/teichoic acid export membrane protein
MSFNIVLRVGKRAFTFVGAQSSVQVLNATTGLLLLRFLPKAEFAIYAIALGLQGTIGILTDLGFGGAISGLVGTRYRDKKVLGCYIGAASYIRRVLILIVSGIGIVCIFAFRNMKIEGHSNSEVIFLAVAVLVTVQFQAWASYYEVPLLLNDRLVSYYGPQIVAAVLRMATAFVLYCVHFISSTTMVMANTLCIVIMGLSYRYLAKRWIEVPQKLSREHAREMIRFLTPLVPGSVYQALQGQVSLLLITIFGHVGQIAEVAAAGRVGQLFLLLNSSSGVLVGPFFARTPHALFLKRYVYSLCAVGAVALLVAASARCSPALYLILLGAKYNNLTQQVQLVVYASAIGYFTGAMWAVAVARKWIFWWSGSLQIVLLTLIQLICVVFLPLSTSEGVLMMAIFTTCGALAVQILHLIQGMSEHKKAETAKVITS